MRKGFTDNQCAFHIVVGLPNLPWSSTLEIMHFSIGVLSATKGPNGVKWEWKNPEDEQQEPILHHGASLGPESFKYCLEQIAERRPDLRDLCKEIEKVLISRYGEE